MIVLKNINGEATVNTIFRGRKIKILPKHSFICEDDEEGRAKADYILENFKFVVDITERIRKEKGGDD